MINTSNKRSEHLALMGTNYLVLIGIFDEGRAEIKPELMIAMGITVDCRS